MKILAIAPTPFFADRGCHMRILGEIKALQHRGHEVLLVTYHLGRDIEKILALRIKNVSWYNKLTAGPALGKFYLDFLLLFKIIKAIRQFKPNIIHAHLHEGAALGIISCWLTGNHHHVPIVFDVQGSLTQELQSYGWLTQIPFAQSLFRYLEKTICQLSHQCVTSNPILNKFLIKELGILPEQIQTIIDGFHIDFIANRDRIELKKTLGISLERPIVLYAGSLLPSKGINNLFKAIPLIITKQPNTFFLVIGYPIEKSKNLVKNLGIADYCLFTGQVDYFQLPNYLQLGDIAIDPKSELTTEASGKIINYMGSGLAVVCYDSPNNRHFLGNTGTFASESTPLGLAKAILELLEDPKSRRRKALEARARVKKNFSWEIGGSQYEKIFLKVLTQKQKRHKGGSVSNSSHI